MQIRPPFPIQCCLVSSFRCFSPSDAMVNWEHENVVYSPLLEEKAAYHLWETVNYISMSMTVSTLLSFSRGKSLEGNTVRTTKEKYSSVCIGDIKGVSQCVGRKVLWASAFEFYAWRYEPLYLSPKTCKKKKRREKSVVIYNRIAMSRHPPFS